MLFHWMVHNKSNKCIPVIPSNPVASAEFTTLFNELDNAVKWVNNAKRKHGCDFYNASMNTIKKRADVPKPSTFDMASIPKQIRDHIYNYSTNVITYHTQIHGRQFSAVFVVDHNDIISQVGTFNKYFDRMVQWLHIALKYSPKTCGKNITTYLYFSPTTKQLPADKNIHINQYHANTAFTYSCPSGLAEIVIFRREEWFKVFIHETFHLLSLDFSAMSSDNEKCADTMRDLFPIKSTFQMYEAYTETWAVLLNACFCSYYCLDGRDNLSEFIDATRFLLRLEVTFKVAQMHKILQFMNLDYDTLTRTDSASREKTMSLYTEETNIFAYHIAATILMCNFEEFIKWCGVNNTSTSSASSAFAFKQTGTTTTSFCQFITDHHLSKNTMHIIHSITSKDCYSELMQNAKGDNAWVRTSMRLSVCEME